ncbi:hypothetical protein BDW_00920 [Bdellovibrio bacteriovorus W]|nr:hypothetical protein BDW_00920 [Bdellovibrio bacteriovorus W]
MFVVMKRKTLLFFVVVLAITPNTVWADVESSSESTKKNTNIPLLDRVLTEEYLEDTRQSVVGQVNRLADRIDSLFGNRRYDDRYNKSTLRISQESYILDGTPGADSPSVSLNLHLPQLKELEKRLLKKITPSPSGGPGGKEKEEVNPWRLNQETGIVATIPIDYFLRLRLSKDFQVGSFLNTFYEQVGWSKKNEWVEKTSLMSDYAISDKLLFRFVNEKEWEMTDRELSTVHGPSVLQQLSAISGISYNLRYSTELDGHDFYSKRVSLSSIYRTQFKLPWIFVELKPELAWVRETNFRALYNFYLKFEFVFGNSDDN